MTTWKVHKRSSNCQGTVMAAHHQAPGEPFGGVGEGGLASFCYLRNSICKYVRNSAEFRGIPGKFYYKNTAEFPGIPYVFKTFRIPPEVKNVLPWTPYTKLSAVSHRFLSVAFLFVQNVEAPDQIFLSYWPKCLARSRHYTEVQTIAISLLHCKKS